MLRLELTHNIIASHMLGASFVSGTTQHALFFHDSISRCQKDMDKSLPTGQAGKRDLNIGDKRVDTPGSARANLGVFWCFSIMT